MPRRRATPPRRPRARLKRRAADWAARLPRRRGLRAPGRAADALEDVADRAGASTVRATRCGAHDARSSTRTAAARSSTSTWQVVQEEPRARMTRRSNARFCTGRSSTSNRSSRAPTSTTRACSRRRTASIGSAERSLSRRSTPSLADATSYLASGRQKRKREGGSTADGEAARRQGARHRVGDRPRAGRCRYRSLDPGGPARRTDGRTYDAVHQPAFAHTATLVRRPMMLLVGTSRRELATHALLVLTQSRATGARAARTRLQRIRQEDRSRRAPQAHRMPLPPLSVLGVAADRGGAAPRSRDESPRSSTSKRRPNSSSKNCACPVAVAWCMM